MNKKKLIYWTLLLLIIGIGIFYFLKTSNMIELLSSPEQLTEWISSFKEKSMFVFFLLQLLSVVIAPIPSNISAVVGGALFGTWWAFFLSMLAVLTGSIIVFIFTKKVGRSVLERFISPKILSKYEHYFESQKGLILLIILLALPFFPDDLISFAAALSSIRLGKYIVILLLTRPWEILAASALGSSNIETPLWVWIGLALCLVILAKYAGKIEKRLVSLLKIN